MHEYKGYRRKFDAYMSVEAAFLVPAATFIIALIIYLSFFMYGKCILSQDVYLLGFRASVFYEKRGYSGAGAYVSDHISSQTSGRYFAAKGPQISASDHGDTVKVEGKLSSKTGPARGFYKFLPQAIEGISGSSAKIRNTPKSLRRVCRIKDLATKISAK